LFGRKEKVKNVMKNGQLKTGRVWGLALAVLFLAAASAQADVQRATDTSFLDDGYELVKIFTFTYDGTAGNDIAAQWNIVYGEGFSGLVGFGYDQTTSTMRTGGVQSLLTSWFDSSIYGGFVGYWDDDASTLTFNGAGVGGTGNWFYNLLFNYGELEDELQVNFGTNPKYVFELYGVRPVEADSPEPATLALMGLGLAGLGLARTGLARRRMKK